MSYLSLNTMTALVAHPERSAQMMGVDEQVLSTWAHRRNLHNNQRLECKTHTVMGWFLSLLNLIYRLILLATRYLPWALIFDDLGLRLENRVCLLTWFIVFFVNVFYICVFFLFVLIDIDTFFGYFLFSFSLKYTFLFCFSPTHYADFFPFKLV